MNKTITEQLENLEKVYGEFEQLLSASQASGADPSIRDQADAAWAEVRKVQDTLTPGARREAARLQEQARHGAGAPRFFHLSF